MRASPMSSRKRSRTTRTGSRTYRATREISTDSKSGYRRVEQGTDLISPSDGHEFASRTVKLDLSPFSQSAAASRKTLGADKRSFRVERLQLASRRVPCGASLLPRPAGVVTRVRQHW